MVGCGSRNARMGPPDLPVRYHNVQYDFDFFLPASWHGYSVVTQQWGKNRGVAENGPMLVLRHPRWTASDPYQDIPVLVFTRGQWDALHHGKLWPSVYAGGVMDEMLHNQKYVLGISSRYNANDSVKGWKEATGIVERNRAANGLLLYPE